MKVINANVVAVLLRSYEGTKEYEKQEWQILEETQSCDLGEAIEWMKWYMADALRKGNGAKNDGLRCRFLVAYNTYRRLTNHAGNLYIEY